MLIGTAAAIVGVLVAAPSGGARRSPAPPARIARLRAEDADLAARSRSAVLELYSLDARLATARSQLGALEGRMERLQAQRASIARQLSIARRDSRLSLDRVATRLRYLYDYGSSTSTLDVVLGSTSISQALTRLDDVNEVAAANQSVIEQLHWAEGHLALLARRLATRQRLLAQTTGSLAATVTALGQAQAQRSAYLAALQARTSANAGAIARLTVEARAAEERSLALAAARARAAATERMQLAVVEPSQQEAVTATMPPGLPPTATATPSALPLSLGEHTITVVATGYDLGGTTSTGLPVGYGVAAVDPSVIPLGTHMVVPGYGTAVAADTGGAIVGDRIDLWFPNAGAALAWGIRDVTIVVNG